MELPEEVQIVQGRFGAALTTFGEEVAMSVEVRPTHDLVWAATGQPVIAFGKSFTVPPGMEGTIQVPAVDQPGWRLQATQTPFKMWAYEILITYTSAYGSKKRSFNWQPLMGQNDVDLDLVAGGDYLEPINGDLAVVTSIGPFTGPVTVAQLESLGFGGATPLTWTSLAGKPAVIAAGATQQSARSEINAQVAGEYVTPDQVDVKVSTAVNALVGGAPAALNTFKELADALSADDSTLAALNKAIADIAVSRTVDIIWTGNEWLPAPHTAALPLRHYHSYGRVVPGTKLPPQYHNDDMWTADDNQPVV